ncbi:MAG: DNA-directed RNA polymerase subunit D [Candidatus ainarchaeum sp.]|nr:DNA-directed RNA polymerase subunit D [Candidatus ainarchaeum sp.]
MKIEISESKKDNVMVFSLKDSDLKFANLLRRTLIAGVPTVAIDLVTFYDNTSTIFDEYISHRFGLIPISTPDKLKNEDEFFFVLDEKGPKKVYSGDLKPVNHSVKPALENIPIITLLEDQCLRLEAKAVVNTGKKHAKFQACASSYSVNDKTGEISFKIESFYQLPPKKLLLKALDVLEKDFSDLEAAVEKIK